MDTFLLLVAAVALAVTLLWQLSRKPPNFPPGPPKLPVVGSMPFMPKMPIKQLMLHLSRKYGPVTGVHFGPQKTVILSDLNAVREAFKMEAMAARFNPPPFNELRFGGMDGKSRGLIASSGPEWVEQRRFALRQLRDFGFGKKSMEELINSEVLKLCRELDKATALPKVSLIAKVNISILNALWVIITGQSFELDDPQLNHVVKAFDDAVRNTNRSSVLALYFPRIAKRVWSGYRKLQATVGSVHAVINPAIKDHEDTFDASSMRDFMDVYLREIANAKDPESSFHGEWGKQSLLSSILDLFIAGSETTSNSLLWVLLYMMKYPDVQAKVHAEISGLMGGSGELIALDHEAKLPYTKAVILESMRIVSLVPFSLPHLTTSDVNIAGFNIPKDTQVFANVYSIHMDPSLWSDPHAFQPERFLSADGGRIVNADRMIAFSVGKRECLGKTLAEKEFFLFFANIMNRFSFHKVEGQELPSFDFADDATQGFVRSVPYYDMKIKKRI